MNWPRAPASRMPVSRTPSRNGPPRAIPSLQVVHAVRSTDGLDSLERPQASTPARALVRRRKRTAAETGHREPSLQVVHAVRSTDGSDSVERPLASTPAPLVKTLHVTLEFIHPGWQRRSHSRTYPAAFEDSCELRVTRLSTPPTAGAARVCLREVHRKKKSSEQAAVASP